MAIYFTLPKTLNHFWDINRYAPEPIPLQKHLYFSLVFCTILCLYSASAYNFFYLLYRYEYIHSEDCDGFNNILSRSSEPKTKQPSAAHQSTMVRNYKQDFNA